MFYLASKLYHIDAGTTNQYIFNFSIIREFDQFLTLLELYKLRVQDEFTLNIVIKHCTENPNRLSLLTKVDNQLQDSLKLSYYDVEKYLPVLKQKQEYVNQNYTDDKLINFKIFNDQFIVIFNKLQINRFYCDINSYYSNYILLESLYQLTLNNTVDTNKKDIVNIANQKDSLKQDHIKEIQTQQKQIELPKQESEQINNPTKLDDIFSLCLNNVLKSFLLHITSNYYIYISEEYCKHNENNYTFPNLFPMIYIFNTNYFKSLLISLNNYSIDHVKMRIQKALMKLKEEFNVLKPLEKMILINMIFLYYLRFIQDTHTDYLNNNITKLFNDSDLQTRVLNNHTKTYFPNVDMTFEIKDISVDDMCDNELNKNIENIGEKYKHLTSVSEKDFVDKVLIDLDKIENNKKDDLLLNNNIILNLNDLKNNIISESMKKKLNENNLINQSSLNTDYYKIDKLYSYDFKNECLTNAYSLFKEYVNDSSMFVVKLKKGDLNLINISKSVINLFESIKNILYDTEINIQNYFNTYNYYKILCKNLNDSSSFPHHILLYVIYQIIIPHLYLNYEIQEFEDPLS